MRGFGLVVGRAWRVISYRMCNRSVARLLLACLLTLALAAPTAAREVPACECERFDAPPVPASFTIKGVPVMGQWWNLSCEYAATTAATSFYGSQITQGTFLNEIGYHPNPHHGFRGKITGPWGGVQDYGIYAEPIAEVLHAHGFPGSYVFYGGEELLRAEVSRGHPVVVWLTGNYRASTRYIQTYNGESYSLIPNEHAVTVYAYDADSVWVMDPSDPSKYAVSWRTFLFAWSQFDYMALVVAR